MQAPIQIQLETIFKQHYHEWCLLSFSYLGNSDEAEDAVQDVFVNLLQREREVPIINLKAYVNRAVRNVCLKKIEHLKKSVLFEENNLPVPSAETDLILAETSAMLFRGMDSLPEQSKRVFKLCVLDGHKYKNAAQILGISKNTVKYHLKKSFKTLRFSLQNAVSTFIVFIFTSL